MAKSNRKNVQTQTESNERIKGNELDWENLNHLPWWKFNEKKENTFNNFNWTENVLTVDDQFLK